MMEHGAFGFGGGLQMSFMMIFLWGLLIAVVVWLVRLIVGSRAYDTVKAETSSDSLDALKKISRDEYERIRKDIS